jgi:membrane-bound metal-dependent hydrolase YbcI (DUF457 family)
MANFNTHITCGAIASGLGATVVLAYGLVPATELLPLVGAGIVGSTMPDIDLDRGNSVRSLFGVLGITLASGVALNIEGLPLWELFGVWLAVFAGTSVGLCHVFMHYTAHRGIWHSILAAAFFAAVTIATLSGLFGQAPAVAWLGGLFMAGGYLVHLALDEVYAVDWRTWPWRAKKSLWTALKLYDHHHPRNSAIMAAAVLALLLSLAPSPMPLVSAVHASQANQLWAAK